MAATRLHTAELQDLATAATRLQALVALQERQEAVGADTSLIRTEIQTVRELLAVADYLGAQGRAAKAADELGAETERVEAAEAEAQKYGQLQLSIGNGAGATVVVSQEGTERATATASDQGAATLTLATGSYTVVLTRTTYDTHTLNDVQIKGKEITVLSPVLNPRPVPTPTPTPTPRATSTPKATATPTSGGGSSTAHSSYERTTVASSRGSYTADILRFQLGAGKIKVITETAQDEDCTSSCSVMSVKSYADRHTGAIAAVNGTYFCPADYASCSSETGSFFWKIRNPRVSKTINTSNGLGENDSYLTFSSNGTGTFYDSYSSAPSVWAGINHKPTVVRNGSYSVDENSLDSKQRTSKISRQAIGLVDQTLVVATVQGATVMDLGAVMVALGVRDALNLDAGGSSAIWYNGSYRRGPGRGVPNAIVFVEQ